MAYARPEDHTTWLSLVGPGVHGVQFYEDDDFLVETVGRFLAAGLDDGEHVLVIATGRHRSSLMRYLMRRCAALKREPHRAIFLSAHDTLSRFMRGGMPDGPAFEAVVESVLKSVRAGGAETSRIRAYGEMVDVLWKSGNAEAAVRLEELWNKAAETHEFALLCAYATANFEQAGDIERFLDVCKQHSHVLPTQDLAELLGDGSRPVELGVVERREQAQAEADIAFRELLVGALGRELRLPLNALLTTARLMLSDPDGTSRARLERIIATGARLRGAVDQITALAHAGLAGGVPIHPKDDQAVGLVVAKVVEQIRAANPGRAIELRSECPCIARIDPERFAQVVSTLLGNALEHGDARPITVTVTGTPYFVMVGVRNHCRPIDPALIPLLFDPFRRSAAMRPRTSLGLGLYVCERIVAAHHGEIDVRSSEEEGTCFEVIVPTRA